MDPGVSPGVLWYHQLDLPSFIFRPRDDDPTRGVHLRGQEEEEAGSEAVSVTWSALRVLQGMLCFH